AAALDPSPGTGAAVQEACAGASRSTAPGHPQRRWVCAVSAAARLTPRGREALSCVAGARRSGRRGRRRVDTVAVGAAREPLVLALDVGTSSVRALVYDAAGQIVDGAAVHASYTLRTTADGGVEADADALIEHTLGLLDALAVQAPAAFGAMR